MRMWVNVRIDLYIARVNSKSQNPKLNKLEGKQNAAKQKNREANAENQKQAERPAMPPHAPGPPIFCFAAFLFFCVSAFIGACL